KAPTGTNSTRSCRGWSRWPGLNRRPTVYETVALPAELHRRGAAKITSVGIRLKRLNIPPTMNRLEEILAAKREEIEPLRPRASELDRQARARNDFRDFRSALTQSGEELAVIAEIKKASPSAGVIVKTFDPI